MTGSQVKIELVRDFILSIAWNHQECDGKYEKTCCEYWEKILDHIRAWKWQRLRRT